MTDRELLEYAAMAAGINWIAYYPNKTDNCDLCLHPNGDRWNPLTDDGDALRLAVKLQIHPMYGFPAVAVCAFSRGESDNPDPYAATRRAIVRAAASIGKTL